MVDVTDMKRAQEAAAREQARFRAIFESAPVGISWQVFGDAGTHLVNPEHVRLTGVSAEQARQPGAFGRATHPDDRLRQGELAARFLRGEIDHFTLDKRYVHPDGRVVWVSFTSRMLTDAATGEKQAVTTLVDISALKEAEVEVGRKEAMFRFIHFGSIPRSLLRLGWRGA